MHVVEKLERYLEKRFRDKGRVLRFYAFLKPFMEDRVISGFLPVLLEFLETRSYNRDAAFLRGLQQAISDRLEELGMPDVGLNVIRDVLNNEPDVYMDNVLYWLAFLYECEIKGVAHEKVLEELVFW